MFTDSVKKFSLLEELDISFNNLSKTSLAVIGQSCPLLKTLNLDRSLCSKFNFYYGALSAVGNTMRGLHHLLFSGVVLDHDGLLAVLDGCPLLESLDLRKCIIPRQNLERRCRQKITEIKFPKYFFDDDLDVDDAYVLMNFRGLDN